MADWNIHVIKVGDKDYPLVMELVPFAEKYNLLSINGLTVVPLCQVIDALSVIKADYIIRNGIKCCPTCMKPINGSCEEREEDG